MEFAVAWHAKLDKAYSDLPPNKRTRESKKTIAKIKQTIEEMAAVDANLRELISTLMSQCPNDLEGIVKEYEEFFDSLCVEDEKNVDVKQKKKKRTEEITEASSSTTGSGEPAATSEADDCDMAWLDVQDGDEKMAMLRRAIKDLHKQLCKKDGEMNTLRTQLKELRDDLNVLQRQNSRLYIGAVVNRLSDYLAPLTIQSLTEEVAEDPNVNQTVEAIVRAAQQEFRNAKKKAPLDAFKTVAEKARRDRNEMAHPQEVDAETIKRACSGRTTDLLLLNVLLAVADDKQFPLRSSSEEDDY